MADLTQNKELLQNLLEAVNNLPSNSGHTHPADDITTGIFQAAVAVAPNAQPPISMILRNSKLMPTVTNPENNGEIVWNYE